MKEWSVRTETDKTTCKNTDFVEKIFNEEDRECEELVSLESAWEFFV